MNSQPANTYPASFPDARIDQVLNALRTTEPPTGLEQRIAARLAQAAEAHTQTAAAPSPFAVILTLSLPKGKDPRILLAPANLYLAAGTALTLIVALTTVTLVHHRAPVTTARTTPAVLAPASSVGLEPAGLLSRHTSPPTNPTLAADNPTSPAEGFSAAATNQVPRGFTLGSHSPLETAGVLTPASQQDPEAIALAETLAPSRPAPPMPLTAQEKLIQSATRPGQPIQLAELDLARAPHLRAAAQARENEDMERYVKSLLAPFAVADALQPTTDSQPQETPAPAPPTSNSSN